MIRNVPHIRNRIVYMTMYSLISRLLMVLYIIWEFRHVVEGSLPCSFPFEAEWEFGLCKLPLMVGLCFTNT